MTSITADLRAAIALLTRFPVAVPVVARAGAGAFPVVGLLVGVLAAVPVLVVGAAEPVLAAIGAVGVAAIVSGGLHLDGLADTTDALMAPDPIRAEVARRDPRVGSGGVIALVLVIGAEVTAIASLASSESAVVAAAMVVAAMTVARAIPVVAVALGRSRSDASDPEDGFGAWFASQVGTAEAVIAAGVAALVVAGSAMIVGTPSLVVAVTIGAVAGAAVTAAIRAARGRLDGDGLGASIELTVAAILVSAAVLGG